MKEVNQDRDTDGPGPPVIESKSKNKKSKSKKTSKFLSPEASLGGKENTNKPDSHSSSYCSTQFLMDDMW